VLWDQGTGGSFVSLGSSSNQLAYTPNYQLITGYTYKFKVRAVNQMGAGPESDVLSLISASPPDTPGAPLLFEATIDQITITWDPVYNGGSPILGYNIKMAQVGSSISSGRNVTIEVYNDITSLGTLNLPNRRFTTANNLVIGSHYRFKIQAYNGVLPGEFSVPSARIITALVPSEPQNLHKIASTKSTITVGWHAPLSDGGALVIRYQVYSNTGAGTEYFLSGETTTLEFTHENLSPAGITMNYKVTAVNDIGESEMTDSISIILGTVPQMPSAPVKVSATRQSIKVKWDLPDNGGTPITKYNVYINSGTGGQYIQIGTSTTREFEAIGLTTGQTYKFKVEAVNAIGTSPISDASSGIVAAVVPDSPG
jgi:predicted phage tail protein